MLSQLPIIDDPRVLVGRNTADDAAVYQLTEDLALVQTVDFFPPVVDDPYTFGAIAAANAVSDVYAMGGRPVTALNIVCFPKEGLERQALVDILRGGADKAAEAGFIIVGGHTIDDPEPKYGLAVTGLIHPGKIVTNAAARPGDSLILTKPLGIGILTTAMKADKLGPEGARKAMGVMTQLNNVSSQVMVQAGVKAATDVTGFGLLGHLHEMTEASGVGAEVYASRVPVIAEAWAMVREGLVPGGTHANRRALEHVVSWDDGVSDEARLILCDAQTSGGLLMCVPPPGDDEVLESLRRAGVVPVARIGRMVADVQRRLHILP